MRHLARLHWNVALAAALAGLTGWLTTAAAVGDDPVALTSLAVLLAAQAALSTAVAVGLGMLRARSAVDAVVEDAPPGDRRAAAETFLALPGVLARGALAGGLAGAAALLALSQAAALDVPTAAVPVSAGAAVLAALLVPALVSGHAASLAAAAGGSEHAGHGSLRARVLFLVLGGALVCALMGGPGAGVRAAVEAARARVDAADRALAAVGAIRGVPPQELARAAAGTLGTPAFVVDRAGAILAQAGALPAGVRPPARPGVSAAPGGQLVVRDAGPDRLLALYLPDTPYPALPPGPLLRSAAILTAALALLGWLTARALAAPYAEVDAVAERIASGDLRIRPSAASPDEAGRTADRLRAIAEELAALVRDAGGMEQDSAASARSLSALSDGVRRGAHDAREAARSTEGGVEAMVGSVNLIGRGISGLSEYVAGTGRAVSEMADAFEDVQRKAGELERAMAAVLGDVEKLGGAGRDAEGRLAALEGLAGRAGGTLAELKASVSGLERAAGVSEATAATVADMAEGAGLVMEATARGIDTLRGAVADAHHRIESLGRRSDDIDQVVDFISEVAGRTNLLSLNASIIASQAGEHGKAFAVVADQIRDLAAQIARSTKSIGDIIRAVREDVEGTAALIERGDALASDGVQLARNSLEALAEIRRSTAGGRETAAGIRAAVQAHAQASRDMAELVEMVAEGSRAVSAAVQLVGRSVGGVHSISRGVTGMADRVARALEDQSGLSRRQLENLSRLEKTIQDLTRAVESHQAASARVKEALRAMEGAAGEHDGAADGMAGAARALTRRAEALATRVARFKV